MNEFTLKITCCDQCPELGEDDNKTRIICKLNGRRIAWYQEDDGIKLIPDWCPYLKRLTCTE